MRHGNRMTSTLLRMVAGHKGLVWTRGEDFVVVLLLQPWVISVFVRLWDRFLTSTSPAGQVSKVCARFECPSL